MNQSKSSDIFSIFIFLVLFAGIGLVVYFVGILNNNISSELVDQGIPSTTGNETVSELRDNSIPLADSLIFFLFITFGIALIVGAIYLEFDPILIGLMALIVLPLAIWGAMQVTNMFDEAKAQAAPSIATSETFVLTDMLTSSIFPIVVFVILLIVLIILYGRRTTSGGTFG